MRTLSRLVIPEPVLPSTERCESNTASGMIGFIHSIRQVDAAFLDPPPLCTERLCCLFADRIDRFEQRLIAGQEPSLYNSCQSGVSRSLGLS